VADQNLLSATHFVATDFKPDHRGPSVNSKCRDQCYNFEKKTFWGKNNDFLNKITATSGEKN
jgi:hypothetical protein